MIGTTNSFQDLIIEISSDSSNQSNQLRVPADVDFSLFELNFWNSVFPIIYIMLSDGLRRGRLNAECLMLVANCLGPKAEGLRLRNVSTLV